MYRHLASGSLDTHDSAVKRHLDPFSRFCRAHGRDKTNMQTDTCRHLYQQPAASIALFALANNGTLCTNFVVASFKNRQIAIFTGIISLDLV